MVQRATFHLSGPMIPAASGTTRQVVVLLHGYGADGNDLIGLAPFLAKSLPHAAFYSPHAPASCEVFSSGRQWFSLEEHDPDLLRRDPQTISQACEALLSGVEDATPALHQFLKEVMAAEKIDPSALALVGFSQGTMMALHVGLRTELAVAAVVGFSGALVGASSLAGTVLNTPPVMLVHGSEDSVLPVVVLSQSQRALAEIGIRADCLQRPHLDHEIDDVGLKAAAAFLRRAFAC